ATEPAERGDNDALGTGLRRRPRHHRRRRNSMSTEAPKTYEEELARTAQETAPPLDTQEVLAAARRCTWACTTPDNFLAPDGTEQILAVALGAVREEERPGYVERLVAFVEEHRERLEELLRRYGPGSKPASYGRYML